MPRVERIDTQSNSRNSFVICKTLVAIVVCNPETAFGSLVEIYRRPNRICSTYEKYKFQNHALRESAIITIEFATW